MKNLTCRLMVFLSIITGIGNLLSCKREPVVSSNEQVPTSQFTFSFTLPQGGNVLYPKPNTKSVLHTEEEWSLESLWLYVFDASTGNIVGTRKDIKGELRRTADATWIYKYNSDPTKIGVYRFAFVANEDAGDVTNETELQSKLASNIISSGKSSHDLLNKFGSVEVIPMTGYAYQGIKNATDIEIAGPVRGAKVDLTRIVARIDIESIKVPNLIIKKLYIENTNSKSHLFPEMENGKPTYKAPSTSEKVSNISGFAEINPTQGVTSGNSLKKAAYLYEGNQPEGGNILDYTAVILEGTIGGKAATLKIPFTRSDKENIPIHIKRNHLYRIMIGDDTPVAENAKVKFTIEDTPWNGVLMNELWEPISFSCVINDDKLRWDLIDRVLKVKEPNMYLENQTPHIIELIPHMKEHAKFEIKPDSTDWITYKVENENNTTRIKLYLKSYLSENQENKQVFTIKSLSESGDVSAQASLTVIQTNNL